MMPQPRTCKQPRPWSPVPSRCPLSMASRTTPSAASWREMSGSLSAALLFRTRPACVRMSGRVSLFARSRRRGTSPCSRQVVRRAVRTRASPGTACRASLLPSRRARWTMPSWPTWLLAPAAGCCQRPQTRTPGPLRPDGRPRRAARSRARPPDRPPGVRGARGRSARWHARANGTDRNRRLPRRTRRLPGRQPGPSREQSPLAS